MTRNAMHHKMDELIGQFETAMLVTVSLEGKLRARPMAVADHRAVGALYFASRAEDEKLEEILRSSDVAVTMQQEDCYLSISGEARLETDLLLARKLWSPSMRLWFPEGPEDDQLALILVEPHYAEFWDRGGLHRLEFLWEAGKALLKGEKTDDGGLAGHAKYRLGDKQDAN